MEGAAGYSKWYDLVEGLCPVGRMKMEEKEGKKIIGKVEKIISGMLVMW